LLGALGAVFCFCCDDDIGRGYWDGGVGLGIRPELFVKGWVARGSKDARME